MKEVKIESTFTVYDDLNSLSEEIQSLFNLASKARSKAYAPYSEFKVGAALLLDNGEVIIGNNQENASYPSGLCAERTAIYAAGANFPEAKILKIAIVAGSEKNTTSKPIPPCGACRQAIAEYEINQDQPIEIYFKGVEGKVVKSDSLKNLLPLVFDKNVL